MDKINQFRQSFWHHMVTGLSVLVIVYACLDGYSGAYGVRHLHQLKQDELALIEQAKLIGAQRRALQTQIDAMATANIDPDLLEESARNRLGFVHSDEVVVLAH